MFNLIRSEDDTKKSREAARAAAELDAARSTTTTTKDAPPADRTTTTPLAVAAATAVAVVVTSTQNDPSTDIGYKVHLHLPFLPRQSRKWLEVKIQQKLFIPTVQPRQYRELLQTTSISN